MFGFGKPNIEKMKEEKDFKGLMKALRHEKNDYIRVNIQDVLRRVLRNIEDQSSVKTLIKAMSDSDKGVRLCAAEALGRIGDQRAVEPLIKALNDSDYYVQHAAVESLGEIGDQRAVQPLIKVLYSHHKYGAVRALGKIGDQSAVHPLIEALSDSDIYYSRAVAEVLGKIGDQRAIEPLVQALSSNIRYYVRRGAAEVLGEIGGQRAVEPLIKALNDSDGGVRKVAAATLIDMYLSEKIDQNAKTVILSKRVLITEPHHDAYSGSGSSCVHYDHGIGFNFPI